MKSTCENLVRDNSDKLFDLIASELTPDEICHEIKACSVKTHDLDLDEAIVVNVVAVPVLGAQVEPAKPDPARCTECNKIIVEVQKQVTKDMNLVRIFSSEENFYAQPFIHSPEQDQVQKVLLDECAKFPSYKRVCDFFVKENSLVLFELLSEDLTPQEVCTHLKFCAAEVSPRPQQARVPLEKIEVKQVATPVTVGDDPQCVVCEFVMAKLEDELKDKSTREEIKTAVENICSKMPKSVSKQCTKFVDQYADLIITLIDTMPPKQICAQMGLCPAQKKKANLLGDSECTWGPSHFCSDLKIAELCKVRKSFYRAANSL